MKFRFPVVIIDEDFCSENTGDPGVRTLADAITKEDFESSKDPDGMTLRRYSVL